MTLEKEIKDLIKYSIATLFVKPSEKNAYYTPVNLMLIAPPETGKTRILKSIFCKNTYETLDLSPKIIINRLIPKILAKEIRFLVIPDLIQMLGHKKTTTRSTIGFLNALIEEGIKDSDFFGLEFHLTETINCGILTAVTNSEFMKNVYEWDSIGLLHRILPVAYDYTQSKIDSIHREIMSGHLFKDINELSINYKEKKIKIPDKYASEIALIMYSLRDRLSGFKVRTYKGSINKNERDVYFDIKGFRLHDRLRQLARAICFLDSKGKRDSVNADDIIVLREITQVINFPNSKVII